MAKKECTTKVCIVSMGPKRKKGEILDFSASQRKKIQFIRKLIKSKDSEDREYGRYLRNEERRSGLTAKPGRTKYKKSHNPLSKYKKKTNHTIAMLRSL